MSRLLELLSSSEPVRAWVVAEAIETQIKKGRSVGWFGGWPEKREPVILDAHSVDFILDVVDLELLQGATEQPLWRILDLLEHRAADDSTDYRAVLLKATQRQHRQARCFGMQILKSMDLASEESLELVRRLGRDPEHVVRKKLFELLDSVLRRENAHVPGEYRHILLALIAEGTSELRAGAMTTLDYLDLDAAETRQVVCSLLADPDAHVRSNAVRGIIDALNSGRIAAVPHSYAEPLCAAVLEDHPNQPAYLRNLAGNVLAIQSLPVDAQWRLIERLLMSAEFEFSADLRDALFLPNEPAHYRSLTYQLIQGGSPRYADFDWKLLRERFRPLVVSSRAKFMDWATEAIRSDDEITILAGAGLLARVAPDEPDRLTALISHGSHRVRTTVLRSLYPSREQVPLLLEQLNEEEPGTRGAAASALVRYDGSFTPEQIEQTMKAFLAEKSPWNFEEWFNLIQKQTPGTLDFDQLITESLIGSKDARLWAIRQIQMRTGEIAKWLPYLLDGIRAGRLGYDAVLLVIDAGQPIESADDAARMIESIPIGSRVSLRGGGTCDSWEYLTRLIKLCPAEVVQTALLDGLTEWLKSPNETARHAVAARVADLPVEHEAIVATIVDLLSDDRGEVRQAAALTLATLGPSAKAATDRLVKQLADSEARVRMAAAAALGAIGPDAGPEAATALATMAKHDKQPGAQMAAVEAIGRMGPHLQPWIATIDELSKKSDRLVRDAATKVLQAQHQEP
jgi:HEAT repeat protein